MCTNETEWLGPQGLQPQREGIYSILTTFSTYSEKHTGSVSKGGSIVSDRPTGRYTAPTLHLKSGAERMRSV